MAAGTVTIAETTYRATKKVVFTWTAGTVAEDGTASGTTTNAYDGEVIGLTTIPGTGGDAPTDNYDITVSDADGHDVLLGAGKDRDTANTEHVARASLAGVCGTKLTFAVAAAGTSKKGVCIVYIQTR